MSEEKTKKERKGMVLKMEKRVEIRGGEYLLRHTEHWKNIKDIIEEEENYEVISMAMMMSSFPGGDEYALLMKKKQEFIA